MFSDIVIEFENVTKFNLLQYFEDYRNFMQNDFTYVSSYYKGEVASIDSSYIVNLKSLIKKSKNLMQQFINFSSKLSNCGFWELQEYCQDLNDTLEKITKLPKYNRVSATKRGYQPYIQVDGSIGGMKTVQDLAQEIDSNGINEMSLILDNDLSESDWEIDKLSSITAFIDNKTDVVVETILEEPIGKKIYGRDISRKITIEQNDLLIEEYENNIEQKCNILLELIRGDIPEFPNFGKNVFPGKNVANYNYTELVKDLQSVFLQDDLFESVEVTDVVFSQGDINVTCSIKTKYSYSTVKTLKL